MEYQKIINLLDNPPYQTSEFRIKNQVEVNNDTHGTCNTTSQVKFKWFYTNKVEHFHNF